MGLLEDAIRAYAKFEDRADDPVTPAAGSGLIYFKDGALYGIDAAGVVTAYGSGGGGGGSTIDSGAYASRPAGSEGDLYFATDAPFAYRKGASVWEPYGPMPVRAGIEPNNAAFSWANQGAATVDTSRGGIILTAPVSATNNWRQRLIAYPAPPFTLTVQMLYFMARVGTSSPSAALILKDSAGGGIVALEPTIQSTGSLCRVAKWNDATAFGSAYAGAWAITDRLPSWLRFTDDGTNRTFTVSFDGAIWLPVHSGAIGRLDFITPDQIGFGMNGSNAYPFSLWLTSWEIS